ncbi:MAG: Transcriptional repressor SdpR [Tenericutes bacterium ADurb.BinA155]|jgi:DNA-binding transcriptional ArsR family regulator|nr:MAG: Transcriptional repressor SdpR [Tenericutes bacterium ADurb.BinA155]
MENQDIKDLIASFQLAENVLIALGDETRIHMVTAMLNAAANKEHCEGMRVGEIATIASLSRPAISHHIKILKEAGIIQCHREGTKNYYFLDPDTTKIQEVVTCLNQALSLMQKEKKNHGRP